MHLRTLTLLLLSLITLPANAEIHRERLRTRLETLFNEQDLMIRNQKVDRDDLQHQIKEFEALKTFERIPFEPDIAGLTKSLQSSLQDRDLTLVSLRALAPPHKAVRPIPTSLITDEDPSFHLSDDQVAQQVPFKAVIRGDRAQVRAWLQAWPEEHLRITEFEGRTADQAMRRRGKNLWEVRGHAYHFRDIRFPTLSPRDPLELLPRAVRKDPRDFSQKEPLLWSFVTRTQAISPQARPLYRLREELLLNSARMSFFIAKAVRGH